MASNRHLGRIIALQTLYEQDFRRASEDTSFDLEAVLARNIARYEATVDDTAFIERLVRGVSQREAELDATLGPIAPEWPIEQIARMDRVVLRIGLYELEYEKDVPPKVVINEAVELAKAFGSENSSKFVNGVLGTVLRQRDGQDAGAPAAKGDSAASSPQAQTGETPEATLPGETTGKTPSGDPQSATAQADDSAATPSAQTNDATTADAPDDSDSEAAKAEAPAPSAKSSTKTTKTTKATPSSDAATEEG